MLPGGSLVAGIVLAAGEGVRMRSVVPKVLHAVAGRSLVEHAVRAVAGLGPECLVVVVGHGREVVEAHLRGVEAGVGRGVVVAVQGEQRGTGDAVGVGLGVVAQGLVGTVVVCCGDVPLLDTATLVGLVGEHHRVGNAVTVVSAVVADPGGYGRVVRDGAGAVVGIVEHREATAAQRAIQEINSGVYAFEVGVLRQALGRLRPAGGNGEVYLTDVVGLVHAAGLGVGAYPCADPWLVAGVNDRVQLAAVGRELNQRLLTHWMRAGVTIIDPGSVWLDVDVTLAPDVVIHPGVQLHAGTVIGPGATIGPDTTLTGCTIGDGATIVRTHATDATIAPGAQIGPFAHLRPGSHIGHHAKIGTFVETKNTHLGPHAKVPHLSYVGDATIGEATNIGAATVFVNYDGITKHHTTIGAHAKTGADTMFIAPVTIGDGAYTAAGSVITHDVPPGALAIARTPQHNIDNWVHHHRPETPAAHAATQAQQADRDHTRQE